MIMHAYVLNKMPSLRKRGRRKEKNPPGLATVLLISIILLPLSAIANAITLHEKSAPPAARLLNAPHLHEVGAHINSAIRETFSSAKPAAGNALISGLAKIGRAHV